MSERVLLRVIKGGLVPADSYAQEQLRERGYHLDDALTADLRKARNPKFHRKVHLLGALIAANVEEFSGLSAHTVLKRIQLEANIACDEMALNFPGLGPCVYRIPKSLSFASMDEGEFESFYRAISKYIGERYWSGVTPEQMAEMADLMAEEP